MTRREELHCHNCNQYVQFDLDYSMDGNHILDCPKCGHEHCRVIKNGQITGDRWDGRNGLPIIYISGMTIALTTFSIQVTSTASSIFLTDAWSTTASSY